MTKAIRSFARGKKSDQGRVTLCYFTKAKRAVHFKKDQEASRSAFLKNERLLKIVWNECPTMGYYTVLLNGPGTQFVPSCLLICNFWAHDS